MPPPGGRGGRREEGELYSDSLEFSALSDFSDLLLFDSSSCLSPEKGLLLLISN